jgi:ElaB/YqjD/DUF883 family membrane-anchored ribosome-binding protein
MQIKSNYPQSSTNGGDGIIPAAQAAGERAVAGASHEFQNFVADMEDLVVKTTSLTGEELTRAKANLSARIATAKRSIQNMSSAVADSARKTATVTNNYVHDQPWQAVGIGAAVGVLLGFVLGRRK